MAAPTTSNYDRQRPFPSSGDRMTDPTFETLAVLREIRDNQHFQLERQAEALALQREQFALAKSQIERAERINARAEAIQDRSAGMMELGRKMLFVLIPLIALFLGLLLWPYLALLWH
jgi:hypothetical protein